MAMHCCHQNRQFLKWRKDVHQGRKWALFVKQESADLWEPWSKSVLCWKHFEKECFANLALYAFMTSLVFILTLVTVVSNMPKFCLDFNQIGRPRQCTECIS